MPNYYMMSPRERIALEHDEHQGGITIKASSTPEGIVWHLPGGKIVKDRNQAEKAAIQLNRILNQPYRRAA